MIALFENVDFWKALAGMLWPIFALVVFVSAKSKIYAFLGRENLSIKVAGMEISVADATKNLGASVSDLQKRLADLETKFGVLAPPLKDKTSTEDATAMKVQLQEDTTPPTTASRTFSILWVDDYPSNNAFLIDQFHKDGIEVKLALSTSEGIKDFQNGDYDIVITDLGRKEEGVSNAFAGLDLIKQIRARDSKIPILVFAGPRGIENMAKLLKAGATKVSQSEVEVQRLINSVRTTRPPLTAR